MKRVHAIVVMALTAACLVPLAAAQEVELMMKWMSAQDVHYDVVAEYEGTTTILVVGTGLGAYSTRVKDRYELAFDWNATQ